MTDKTPSSRVVVWDPWVRVFHWSLAACVLLNLWLLEEGDLPHRVSGYLAAGLIAWRLGWGFVGSPYARFADFWPTPSRLRAHWQRLRHGERDPHPGHNPAGALMMLALMTLVLALGVSGYLMGLDAFWGETWLENVHAMLASTLQLLVLLHVAAAIVMSRVEGVNLPRAMVTGVKVFTDPPPKQEP